MQKSTKGRKVLIVVLLEKYENQKVRNGDSMLTFNFPDNLCLYPENGFSAIVITVILIVFTNAHTYKLQS